MDCAHLGNVWGHGYSHGCMSGAKSAFTASAREDGRLRPYVFDALCGAGCSRSAPKGEAVFSQEDVLAMGSADEGTNGFDAIDCAHMSKGDPVGAV